MLINKTTAHYKARTKKLLLKYLLVLQAADQRLRQGAISSDFSHSDPSKSRSKWGCSL